MMTPFLTLDRVSYSLPDGRILFTDLSFCFDQRRTGLLGRNGAGKSVLTELLAGQRPASQGRCQRNGRVYRLAQQLALAPQATVASLLGVQRCWTALQRIEDGGGTPADFDAIDGRWDLRQRIAATLALHELPAWAPQTPAHHLSGGQAMRVALAGAWLAEADFLILDEPSNHLDQAGRHALLDRLRTWTGGLLVVSHDRQLLRHMDSIVELDAGQLQRYGGNYDDYCAAKTAAQLAAHTQLAHLRYEHKRERLALQKQHERSEQRRANGQKQRQHANQASILLDRQWQRSQRSTGKAQQHRAERLQVMDQQLSETVR